MEALILRVVIFLLVSVPFMGCSQNENIVPPPDSMEVIPITVVYDGDRPEDSLLYVSCDLSDEDFNYGTRVVNVFYNDSMMTTITENNRIIHPRLCANARKVNYDRNTQTFIMWVQDTNGDAYTKEVSMKADHAQKTYFFEAKSNIKVFKGMMRHGIRTFYLGLLVPKLNPEYTVKYNFKTKYVDFGK